MAHSFTRARTSKWTFLRPRKISTQSSPKTPSRRRPDKFIEPRLITAMRGPQSVKMDDNGSPERGRHDARRVDIQSNMYNLSSEARDKDGEA